MRWAAIDQIDEGVIRDTCAFIAARKDCADFVIQGVLRLMAWERDSGSAEAQPADPCHDEGYGARLQVLGG